MKHSSSDPPTRWSHTSAAADGRMGHELHVFRPFPRNVSAGYLTAALLIACGLGLAFEMFRRWWFGDPLAIITLGAIVGLGLFVSGQRLLADIRTYDQLALRFFDQGLEVETASQLQHLLWPDIERIDELTPLDPAVSATVAEGNRRPGDAIVLQRRDGWRFRLDRNRIADYHAMLETLRDLAVANEVPWNCVHELDFEFQTRNAAGGGPTTRVGGT